MYNKITITVGDVEELDNHLSMNGYNYGRVGNDFYVLEDETDYVDTILSDWGYDYWFNDSYLTTNSDNEDFDDEDFDDEF